MSCDSLGYVRVALEANADGAAINFQLHRPIKSKASLPLTPAAAGMLELVGQRWGQGFESPLLHSSIKSVQQWHLSGSDGRFFDAKTLHHFYKQSDAQKSWVRR